MAEFKLSDSTENRFMITIIYSVFLPIMKFRVQEKENIEKYSNSVTAYVLIYINIRSVSLSCCPRQ